jgi:hypothetical protein
VPALLALVIFHHRWWHPAVGIGGAQAGLGRTEGDWPDAAIRALKPDPPPGRMMNMPWSFANDLIWDWPEQPVFVDPRFEAYPRAFLVDALASRFDDGVLDRLIATHRPGWLFVEHCAAPERDRVAHLLRGAWQVTYADVQAVVLVPATPGTEAYRARHPFAPAAEPPGLVSRPPGRRARQRLCYARILGTLGYGAEARAQLDRATAEGGAGGGLGAEVARAAQALPSGTTAP